MEVYTQILSETRQYIRSLPLLILATIGITGTLYLILDENFNWKSSYIERSTISFPFSLQQSHTDILLFDKVIKNNVPSKFIFKTHNNNIDYTIDFGDENIRQIPNGTPFYHTFTKAGLYTIKICYSIHDTDHLLEENTISVE